MAYKLVYDESAGITILENEVGVQVWTSDEEDSDEFQAMFDDFIAEDDLDDVDGWLRDVGMIPHGEELEIEILEEKEGE